jgi:hypothetical protein
MPNLIETLIDYEPDLLDMIAENWGVDQDLDLKKNRAKQIAELVNDEPLMEEILQALPQTHRGALQRLSANNGRMPLDQFERDYGELREIGAARRAKMRPDRDPASISENLYYKGMIARAFFKQGLETMEFIYIPDEFQTFLSQRISHQDAGSIPVLPETSVQRSFHANDLILEHACTLLAALRADISSEDLKLENPEIPVSFLGQVLRAAGLIDNKQQVITEKAGAFLEAPRARSFSKLINAWRESRIVDETHLLSKLEFEGKIKRNPALTREKVLSAIGPLSDEHWIQIDEFVSWMEVYQPDILRSGGEYDSWIIREQSSGHYIKGFENWKHVEGALLRTMIHGPLFWMGLIELGMKEKHTRKPDIFRLSKWARTLMAGKEIHFEKRGTYDFTIQKDGSIIIQRSFPLHVRYQIARFCEWGETKKGRYHYHISHSSLLRATQQGLKVEQLILLINKYGKKPIPPSVPNALERWKKNNLEAVFEQPILLRVRSAKILDELMASRAKRFIQVRLNETSAIVKTGSVEALKNALMDIGILADIKLEV